MDQMTTNKGVCEACNIHLHPNSFQSHFAGKKHLAKQEAYDRKHKTVFVSGTAGFTENELMKIFRSSGQVLKITKDPKNKGFAFIRFEDESSVEKALKARLFAKNARLFVRRYDDKRPDKPVDKKESGVADLPVDLPRAEECPDPSRVLEWQVDQFISQVELPMEMYRQLNYVVEDMEALFAPQLPGCRALVFGSCGSTLAFKNSDVDLFLQCMGEQPEDFVRKEAKVLYRSPQFNVVARIPCARVPIVKFEHRETGWQGDLTANSRLGLCNSRLIRFLISLDPRIRPLVMVVKYWAKLCGVSGPNQRMTTYAVVMLVIFYLQTLSPPLLPSVATLQQLSDVQEFDQGWNCSFCDEEWTVSSHCPSEENKMSLKELLTGFFYFYKTFDYSNVICPLLGRSIPSSDFENPDSLPEEMYLYKEIIKTCSKMEFRTYVTIKMQDPFELNINMTKNVSDKICSIFLQACEVSYELCEKSDESCLLNNLFSIQSESFDNGEQQWRFHIPFPTKASKASSPLSDEDLNNWYELTLEAVLLVMKEVLNLSLEPSDVEVFSKVKKLESSTDVHTTLNSESCDDLVYVCSAKADLLKSRKKTSKALNKLNFQNLSLSLFEREVCISKALYCSNDTHYFTFNLYISSFDKFKARPRGLEIVMKDKSPSTKNSKKFIGEMGHFLARHLNTLVLEAALFIKNSKESSPVTEVKDSLRNLLNLMLTIFPGAKESEKNEEGISKESSLVEQQGTPTEESNHELASSSNLNDKSFEPEDNKSLLEKETAWPTNDVEECEMKSAFSPSRNMQSAETDDFFKPTHCEENTDSKDNKVNGKPNELSNMLGAIRKCETQSSFTCESENPFLRSIEKVARRALCDGDKADDCCKAVKSPMEVDDVKVIEEVEKSAEPTFESPEKKISPDDWDSGSDDSFPSAEPRLPIVQFQQRPRVYVERPHKVRKPLNYKPCLPNPHKSQVDPCGFRGHRSITLRPYPQGHSRQSNSSGESSDFQCLNRELVGNNYFSGSDRHQRQISRSMDKQREWYPTLFK